MILSLAGDCLLVLSPFRQPNDEHVVQIPVIGHVAWANGPQPLLGPVALGRLPYNELQHPAVTTVPWLANLAPAHCAINQSMTIDLCFALPFCESGSRPMSCRP